MHFLKNIKKVPQKIGGSGGQRPPGKQERRLSRSISYCWGGDPPKNKNGTLIWNRSGIDPASIRHRSGMDLASIWHRFGIDLALLWHRSGIDLASIWDRFGMDLGSIQGLSETIREASRTIREAKKLQKSKKSAISISPIAF